MNPSTRTTVLAASAGAVAGLLTSAAFLGISRVVGSHGPQAQADQTACRAWRLAVQDVDVVTSRVRRAVATADETGFDGPRWPDEVFALELKPRQTQQALATYAEDTRAAAALPLVSDDVFADFTDVIDDASRLAAHLALTQDNHTTDVVGYADELDDAVESLQESCSG